MTKSPLFVGTANRVYAIDRDSGRVIWDIKLNDHGPADW
jgi:outer membrane protein assembly factor BamB